MAEVELIMPKMGESITEATILKWLKKEGDSIAIDEPVLEIATDKVDSEVPSPVAGTLVRMLFNVNDVVPVNKAIAIIQTTGAAATTHPIPVQEVSQPIVSVPYVPSPDTQTHQTASTPIEGRFYSPLVLNIARSEGINMTELEMIPGTGQEGRVTKKDILFYVANRSSGQVLQTHSNAIHAIQQPNTQQVIETIQSNTHTTPTIVSGNVEIIEMDRMRQLIAKHMVMSLQTSPHVTSFVEADVTNMVLWREKVKKGFEKREGEKITFTPMFIEAVVKAIKDFPLVNVSVDGTRILKKRDINIGMAAALPSGNLIVPVIKNADFKNLIGLTKEVNDFANRARNNQLKPHEIGNGTFTITNVGTFGNVMGTPIINQPQVAILATGAIRKKPAVVETVYGDVIAIRHMMYLSLSYDHRVVDGALGGSFLRRIADYMEQWDVNRDI